MSSLGMDEHSVSSGISISRVFSEQIITFMLTSQQPWRGQSHAHFTQRMSLLGPGSHPTLDLNLALPEFEDGCSPLLPFPPPSAGKYNQSRPGERETEPSVPDDLCNSLANSRGLQLAESDPRVGKDTCCLPLGPPPSPYVSHSQ